MAKRDINKLFETVLPHVKDKLEKNSKKKCWNDEYLAYIHAKLIEERNEVDIELWKMNYNHENVIEELCDEIICCMFMINGLKNKKRWFPKEE